MSSFNKRDVDFFDPDISECPYGAYKILQDNAPVWQDPKSGMFIITRYEDVQEVLKDTKSFRNKRDKAKTDRRSAMLRELYREKGWIPAPTLAGRDDPEHKEMRKLFAHAFRPQRRPLRTAQSCRRHHHDHPGRRTTRHRDPARR